MIKSVLRREGSRRDAARVLLGDEKLYGQLWKMERGLLRDTPQMKTALRRADRRWLRVRDRKTAGIDLSTLKEIKLAIRKCLNDLESLIE